VINYLYNTDIKLGVDYSKVKVSKVNFVLLLLGTSIHFLAEVSFMPILAAFIYYIVGRFILFILMSGGIWEYRIFTRIFLSGFVSSSIASLYRIYAQDNQGDALHFYENSLLDIRDIERLTSEHALPMFFFKKAFDIANYLAIPQQPYVGVFLNVLLVAFTGVIAIKSARIIYGNDIYRFKQLIFLTSLCGIFWLYAGVMLRDAFSLLGITLLMHAWIYFLKNPCFGFRLLNLIGVSFIGVILFQFIRAEYLFIPLSMALAGTASLLFGSKKNINTYRLYPLLFIGFIGISFIPLYFGDQIINLIWFNQESYYNVSLSEHSQHSLGWMLIVDQPPILRGILGSLYLFVFPIPFWTGFQLDTVYSLFKSFNVIYLYFVVPLMILSFKILWKEKKHRSPMVLFLLLLLVGFTLSVAFSSMETRHHGNFFIPLLLISILPNLQDHTVFRQYKYLLIIYLLGVLLVHITWIMLKLTLGGV